MKKLLTYVSLSFTQFLFSNNPIDLYLGKGIIKTVELRKIESGNIRFSDGVKEYLKEIAVLDNHEEQKKMSWDQKDADIKNLFVFDDRLLDFDTYTSRESDVIYAETIDHAFSIEYLIEVILHGKAHLTLPDNPNNDAPRITIVSEVKRIFTNVNSLVKSNGYAAITFGLDSKILFHSDTQSYSPNKKYAATEIDLCIFINDSGQFNFWVDPNKVAELLPGLKDRKKDILLYKKSKKNK